MSKETLKNSNPEKSSANSEPSRQDNQKIGRKTIKTPPIHKIIHEKLHKALEPWEEYVNTLSDQDILDGNFDKSKLTRTAEDFHLDYKLYPFLRRHTEHAMGNNKIIDIAKNIDYIGYSYTRYTADLINQICGRYKVEKNFEEFKSKREKIQMPADHIIYLDKSGRPLSYLVNLFWDEFAPKDKDGHPVKRPPHSFANLDRISVLQNLLQENDANENNAWIKWEKHKNHLTPYHFAMLRSLFLKEPLDPDSPPNPEEVMKMPTILDGKKVLIVDEVEFGGLSMRMAECLLQNAIPEATFAGTTFWQDATSPVTTDNSNNDKEFEGGIDRNKKVNKTFLKALPVWYHSDKNHFQGRGIGDVEPDFYRKQYEQTNEDADAIIANSSRPLSEEEKLDIRKNLRARRFTELYGAAFRGIKISLGPGGEDKGETRRLTKDMQQLLADYRAKKIFPWRNPKKLNYETTAAEDYIIQCIRAGISPDNYTKIKKEIDQRPVKD